MSKPRKFTSLPLRYEYAYGGQCRIEADDPAAKRVKQAERLTAEQRAEHPEQDHPPAAHTVCEYNPVGLGFAQNWWLNATHLKQLPAPRIEHPQAPFSVAAFYSALRGKKIKAPKALQPHGFGLIGRAWTPRRQLAGTYDQTWLDERHPNLPQDFDFAYWNAAPVDQQIAYPPSDALIELINATSNGLLHTQLPGHRAFVLARCDDGQFIPLMMRTDTLLIDAETLTLQLTHRVHLPADAAVRVLEARFEVDPAAPLLKFTTPHQAQPSNSAAEE